MKHRFAEERAPNRDTVKATGELSVGPRLHRMRMPKLMHLGVAFNDLPIDPGIFASGASFDHFRETIVNLDLENFSAQETPKRVRHMKIFQGQDCAWIWLEPFDRAVLHRHRKNTKPITLEQKFRLDHEMR